MHGVSAKTKAEYITEILKRHPLAQTTPSTTTPLTEEQLKNQKQALLDDTSRITNILDKYNDHYGWLDQVDKDFYKFSHSTLHHTWQKAYSMWVLMQLLRNAWVLSQEHTALRNQQNNKRNHIPSSNAQSTSLLKFVHSVAVQICIKHSK